MAGNGTTKWKRLLGAARDFFQEHDIASDAEYTHSRMHRFAHFWLLVGKSFKRNRGPVRAAALAYTTLLALVPMLAVAVSITTSMLQKGGKEQIGELINQFVDYIAPALDLETRPEDADPANNGAPGGEASGRERIVNQISGFIERINSGTLGVTSVVALLFVAISLLRTIEATFNDIWGVTVGRGWFKSIVYYWTTITLGPLFLVGAITLTSGPHLASSKALLDRVPFLGTILFHIAPFLILSLGFAALYALIPNTKVKLGAALVGGAIGGSLWQLNNMLSVIYVSRAVTYTNIYGSLGIIPLFLVGMYFSWLIMLFGAQVAYAWQNRDAYVQEKQAEGVNQRGREFMALRMMTHIARNFIAGGHPLSLVELSRDLTIPSQLAQRILCNLKENGLLVEVMDSDIRFSPARPLDRISAYHVVCALRAGTGHELATSDDDARLLVRTEFERMVLAERDAGSAVTLQTLAELTAKQISQPKRPALPTAS